jgi:hypothetical protein
MTANEETTSTTDSPPPEGSVVSTMTLSTDMIAPMAVITFHLPEPFGNIQLNIPASDIAKPANPSEPSSTAYTKDYRKTVLLKVIREIELLLDEQDLLDNNEHFSKLKELLEYPNIKKETFEHFFKMSVSSTNALFEIYPKYLLPHFINMYTSDTSDPRIVAFHLQFVGAANRHLKNALSKKSLALNFTPTAILQRPPKQSPPSDEPIEQNSSNTVTDNDDEIEFYNDDDDDAEEEDYHRNESDHNNQNTKEEQSTVSPSFRHLNGVRNTTTKPHQPRRVSFSSQSENDGATPQTKVNVPWNSYERKSYLFNPTKYTEERAKYDKKNAPRYSDTTSWTRARFNPDDADLVIDPTTGLFRPWQAERPEYGPIECHPIQINEVYMIRELFISTFQSSPSNAGFTRLEPKRLNLFKDAFPPLGPEDVNQFLYWHNDLVEHCLTYGIFVPPIHTLRPEQYLGTWFDDMPPYVQLDTQKYFSHLLTSCLRSKMNASLRQEYPTIANIIQHGSRNGYKILYLLAKQAGKHPLLIRYPFDPPEPVQSADTTMEQYITNWTQYLQHRLLDGTIYCDRYFVQQFQRNLHPSVQQKLGPKIEQAVDKIPILRPLPKSFGPDEIFQQLEDFADFVKMPSIMQKTPRNAFQQTLPIHELRNSNSYRPQDDGDAIDLPAIIAAVNNTSIPHCYLCESTDHRMAQCPTYLRLQDNPRAITTLLRALKPQSRQNHRNRNRSNGPPRHIRQLTNLTNTVEAGEGIPISSTVASAGEGNSTPIDKSDENTTTIPQDLLLLDEPDSDFI